MKQKEEKSQPGHDHKQDQPSLEGKQDQTAPKVSVEEQTELNRQTDEHNDQRSSNNDTIGIP